MIASGIQFIVSAAVIIVAGVVLTHFADVIASRTKLGRLLVGSIMLAAATSLPELFTDIHAVRLGAVNLAVGDLMGSSLMNLLILAVLDLTRFSRGRMLSKASAAHAIAACTSIMLTALAAIFILLGPKLEAVDVADVDVGSVAMAVAYFIGVRLIYVGQMAARTKTEVPVPMDSAGRLQTLTLKRAVMGYGIAAAVILFAAPFLASAADDLASQTGLGGTFFGTTFVALSTSLPEMVTTFTAVRMQAFDLAIGNILGSNCFNMVILVPLDFFHDGSLFAVLSVTHVYTGLCAIVVTAVVILGHLYAVEKRMPLLEPDALLAIALILAALAGLYYLR